MYLSTLRIAAFFAPVASILAQAPSLELNTICQCRVPLTMKVTSCTGNTPSDTCAVQVFNAGRPLPSSGKSTHAQVMAALQTCHKQTPAEAQAEKSGAVQPANLAPPAGAGGGAPFKVGDRVRVLFNGWQEGTVQAVRGPNYDVLISKRPDRIVQNLAD